MSETVGYSPWPVIWDVDTEGVSDVVGGNVVSSVPECAPLHQAPRFRRCEEAGCTGHRVYRFLCQRHYDERRNR